MIRRDSLPALLRYEDRNAMAFSIESRVPLLTNAILRAAAGARGAPPGDAGHVTADGRIVNGQLKMPLRAAMRGSVPDVILDRRDKIGFSAPTARWMRTELRPWWRDLIASRRFDERGCFAPDGVRQLVARLDGGDDAAAGHLFRVAIVEQWARQFIDA